MSLSLALAFNTIAVVALLGALAWFMSHPRKLKPHVSARHPGHRFSIVHNEALEAESRREERIAA